MSVRVFDFFSGCGGTSAGLRQAGCRIMIGIDNNADATRTFHANFPEAALINLDIREMATEHIRPVIDDCGSDPKLFCACAPCQPFSKQNKNRGIDTADTFLLVEFERYVCHYMPEYIFVENVPGMQRIDGSSPLNRFLDTLSCLGYKYNVKTINFQVYGVPQRRHRTVLLASLWDGLEFPEPTHGPLSQHESYSTVREWIGALPSLIAGQTHDTLPNHVASNLSPLNMQRIIATPLNGDRRHWDEELVLACHKGEYTGHTDVYGRLCWDEPAVSLTTRCHSLSNGRFGHPEQHRAISIREAACLQTFPLEFAFKGNMQSCARQIGNAVPVLGAQRFGDSIILHYNQLYRA